MPVTRNLVDAIIRQQQQVRSTQQLGSQQRGRTVLGGSSGPNGGTGGPPGGFVGKLPQSLVCYDTTEAATSSGSTSLLDNLNHIRQLIADAPGDVTGPVSSTDNAIVRWNGTSGSIIQDSNTFVDDGGNLWLKAELRFYDNGNYVGFEAPALGADQIWVLPATDGNANQVLGTDGSGNLDWQDAQGDIVGPATSTDHAVARWDGTSGSILLDSGVTIDDSNNLIMAGNLDMSGGAYDVSIPDNNPAALEFAEATNKYLTLDTTDGSERIKVGKDIFTDRWLAQTSNTFLGIGVAGAGTLAHASGNQGYYNTALGNQTLYAITTGAHNLALGYQALENITTGYWNIGIGERALHGVTTGANNFALGSLAGYGTSGSSEFNIFIGGSAGFWETGSNKLYIDTTDTATPLIYGEFDNDLVRINGDLDVTGDIDMAGQLTNTLAIGTAPFVITSTTKVDNLHVARATLADTVTDNANLTGVITSVGNATSIASQTGIGTKFVVDTSPTLVTPVLGTPTSGSLANCTALPISTGVSGLGANVATFLATPSSANLAAAVTDETGTGTLVFADTPTLVTPVIGVATGTSLDLGATTLYGSRAITVDTGGVLNIDIGSAAGDDFTVDISKLVVEGDTGYVGIGTASPPCPLSVVGSGVDGIIYARQNTLNKAAYIMSADYDATGGLPQFILNGLSDTNRQLWVGYDTTNDRGIIQAAHQTVGYTNLILNGAGGNVGIGTTHPDYLLEVNTDSAGKPGAGGLWTVVSDERLKEKIELADLDRCYEIVKTLPLKRFTFKDTCYTDEQIKDRSVLGWISQDVQPIFPKAVNAHDFVLPKPKDAPDDYEEEVIEDCLDLDAGQITAAMYGALQRLIQKVESIEAKNKNTKGKI